MFEQAHRSIGKAIVSLRDATAEAHTSDQLAAIVEAARKMTEAASALHRCDGPPRPSNRRHSGFHDPSEWGGEGRDAVL